MLFYSLLIGLFLNSYYSFCLETPSNKIGAKLFDQVKQGVLQIKTAMGPDSPKASYGSGFVIDKAKGLIATNYHVVATVLQDESKLQKIYIVEGTASHLAKVLAFSAVHDIAILKVEKTFPVQLELFRQDSSVVSQLSHSPKKGEKIYSLGVPKDLNLSMVEGTYNGNLSFGLGIYEEIHLSSAINSGMSGGPSLNSLGEVIGINVSVMLNSQNISFCVPVKFLEELLKNTKTYSMETSFDKTQLTITNQLNNVQNSLTKEFLKNERMQLDDWIFYQLPSSLKCWSENQDSPKFTYSMHRYDCNLNASMFIKEGVYTGTYDIHYFSIKNKSRNPFQFFSLLNYIYNEPFFEGFLPDDSNENFFTRQSCDQKIFVNDNFVTWKVNYCLIGYTHYPNLYNVIFKAVSLNSDSKALLIKYRLNGFSLENIKNISSFLLGQTKISLTK